MLVLELWHEGLLLLGGLFLIRNPSCCQTARRLATMFFSFKLLWSYECKKKATGKYLFAFALVNIKIHLKLRSRMLRFNLEYIFMF